MGTAVPGPPLGRIPVDKSPVLAFLLTFFLGPLGLLYVKIVPALILMVVAAAGYFTLGITSIVAWIVSIVWACAEASSRHRAFEAWRAATGSQGVPLPGYQQASAQNYLPGQSPPLPPPGWYPDSGDRTRVRWWDGGQWVGDSRAAD